MSIHTEALSLNVFEIFDLKFPCAHTHTNTHTDTHTDTRRKVISYSVPCKVLHWTDNYVTHGFNLTEAQKRLIAKAVYNKITFVRTRSLSNAITFSIQPTWRPLYEVM